MITDGVSYITLLLLVVGILSWIEHRFTWKIFTILPSIVIIYALVMIMASFGVFAPSENVKTTYTNLKDTLLPAMIFLMLLDANMRSVLKLGKKMIFTFLLATLSIVIGFIISFSIFHSFLSPDAWMGFGALCGSWIGGTGNMLAIAGAIKAPNTIMGNILITDSTNYTLWVMLLLALVPYATKFNRWSKADTSILEKISNTLNTEDKKSPTTSASLLLLLGLSLEIKTLSVFLAFYLPTTDFISQYTWVVLLVTFFGIMGALTPLRKIGGSNILASMMLYTIVALIASQANFSEISQAPLFIITGSTILLIHLLLMIIFAKLFKLDLFSLGVASLANIGGVASAPILASAYSKALIPIGILMALLGYIIGTGVGLVVAKILQVMS